MIQRENRSDTISESLYPMIEPISLLLSFPNISGREKSPPELLKSSIIFFVSDRMDMNVNQSQISHHSNAPSG